MGGTPPPDDVRGTFLIELSLAEFYQLQRRQYRGGETLEDTLLRLAVLRYIPRKDTAGRQQRCEKDSTLYLSAKAVAAKEKPSA